VNVAYQKFLQYRPLFDQVVPNTKKGRRFLKHSEIGTRTMTTENSENGAIAMPRMNVSGYVRHATTVLLSAG